MASEKKNNRMSDRRLDEKLKMIKETIYIWGTGKATHEFIYEFGKQVLIKGFIDNNIDAVSPLKGVPVLKFGDEQKGYRIVICSSYQNYKDIEKQISKAGKVESKDYVYCRFYNKKRAVVIGNCHTDIIKKYLASNAQFNLSYGIYNIPANFQIITDAMQCEDYSIALKNADLVIHQDIRDTNSLSPIFGETYVKENMKKNAIYIKILNTYGMGRIYYPYFKDFNENNHVYMNDDLGVFPIKDELIEECVMAGMSVQEIIDNKRKKNDQNSLVEITEKILAKYEIRESECDVKIMEYIKSNYKEKKLFHDRAHPINEVLYEQVKQIFDILGIFLYSKKMNEFAEMSKFALPIYPEVEEKLNLKFHERYVGDNLRVRLCIGILDIDEYIKEYIYWCYGKVE